LVGQVAHFKSALAHASIAVKIFHESLFTEGYSGSNPAVHREGLEALQLQALLQCNLGMFYDGTSSWKIAIDRATR